MLVFNFLTGMLSPVISDSSHNESPVITLPSTGILVPGTTYSTLLTKCAIYISIMTPQ